MRFSLNEVQAQAKKAARGAGFSWGMAEEAGMATRWICVQGLDGVATLAALLDEAPDTDLCALTQGTRLSDRAKLARSESRVLHRVMPALLLTPFLASIARQTGQSMEMRWTDGLAATDGDNLMVSGQPPLFPVKVTLAATSTPIEPNPKSSRASPSPAAWNTLGRFAHRTYAPATEESRRLGAGDTQTGSP